jgi:hypothetical protein
LETLPHFETSLAIVGFSEGVESIVAPPPTSAKVLPCQFNHRSSYDHHAIFLLHLSIVVKILTLHSPVAPTHFAATQIIIASQMRSILFVPKLFTTFTDSMKNK